MVGFVCHVCTLNKISVMRKKVVIAVIFFCLPVGMFITVFMNSRSTYQGKSALVWFEGVKMAEPSSSLDALKRMGKAAVPTLQLELKSESIGYRYRAAWVLGEMGPVARDAVPDLIQAMNDSDLVVRFQAIKALNALDVTQEDLVPKLTALTDRNDWGVVKSPGLGAVVNESAADLLIKIEQSEKANHLLSSTNEYEYGMVFLRSPDLRVRVLGVNELAKLTHDDPRVVATMESLLKDTNALIRGLAQDYFRSR